MKILKSILDHIHLDPEHNLITVKNVKTIHTIFKTLDIHEEGLNGKIKYHLNIHLKSCFFLPLRYPVFRVYEMYHKFK